VCNKFQLTYRKCGTWEKFFSYFISYLWTLPSLNWSFQDVKLTLKRPVNFLFSAWRKPIRHQILTERPRQYKMHISFWGLDTTSTIKANFYDSRQVTGNRLKQSQVSHIRAYKLCFNLYADSQFRLEIVCPLFITLLLLLQHS